MWHSVESHSLSTIGRQLAGSDGVLRTVNELMSMLVAPCCAVSHLETHNRIHELKLKLLTYYGGESVRHHGIEYRDIRSVLSKSKFDLLQAISNLVGTTPKCIDRMETNLPSFAFGQRETTQIQFETNDP